LCGICRNTPGRKRASPKSKTIADEHGIGLIRMHDPLASEGCEILADPVRKSTLPMAVEGFLETRLSVAQKDSLARVVRGR
jgi:hypothetical protein